MLRTAIEDTDRGGAEEHHGPAGAPPLEDAAPETDAVTPGRGLVFQRCNWCRTPAYRRSFCRACGSSDLAWEHSAGRGVILRRDASAVDGIRLVHMDEGFSLFCRITGTPSADARSGTRVRFVSAAEPFQRGMPAVVLCGPPLHMRC